MRILANTAKMSREEWLAKRLKGIGGSEAATCANLNPYQTQFGLYLEKRGEIRGFDGNERTHWGNKLEDLIAAEFKERNNIWVQRKNFILQHDKHDFMIGNIDREIFDKDRGRGVLEVKNNGHYAGKAWEGDQAPVNYILQMQHYLAITGYEFGYYAVLIDGGRYHQIEILADPELQEMLIEQEAKFWERVTNGNPPPISGEKAESELLKHLYPEATETEPLPLEATAAELIKRREELKAAEDDVKKELAQVENQLKNMLGEHERGYIDRQEIIWKNIVSNRVDSKVLKTEYPDIYEKVCKPTQSRRFEIKTMKEAK